MTSSLNVLVCAPIMGKNLDPVREVSPSVNLIDGNATFITWSRARRANDIAVREVAERKLHELLSKADVVCMMYPVPENLAAFAPGMRWLHHTQAGVSNLWPSDVWHADDLLITSGRGHVRPTAMAEYCIGAALMFARGLHDGYMDKKKGKLDRRHYDPVRIAGATMGIVGMGGIGGETARLAKSLGMRVIGTRRSVESATNDADNADLLLPASELTRLAAESDFIAVCTQLTNETMHLLNDGFFAAITKRPVVCNVSRGEVIDEDALLAALDGGKVRGAVLDVYEGELQGKPPRPELLSHPDIILTPHISAAGVTGGREMMDLFCENLRRFIDGEDLINVVDKARGY